MVASFWTLISQLAAAICLPLISNPTAPTEQMPGAEAAESAVVEDAPSLRQPVDQDLPRFSIETTPVIRNRPASQALDIAITSDSRDDSEKHQPDAEMLAIGNTSGDGSTMAVENTTTRGDVFISLDYAVLTPEFTFSSDTDLPFLTLNRDCWPTSKVLLASLTQEASEEFPVTAQVNGAVPQPDAESVGSQALQDIINRPVSAIRLGAALLPVTAKGDTLKTPEGIGEHQSSRIIETHYIAAPWTIARPPNFSHPIKYQPLYFEDPNLERCGATYGCLTEFSSIAHMGMRIPMLPYLMASNSPHECVRALPDCPTCCRFGMDAYVPRPTAKATAVETAAIVGFIFLIP